jgi:hypothetical protein
MINELIAYFLLGLAIIIITTGFVQYEGPSITLGFIVLLFGLITLFLGFPMALLPIGVIIYLIALNN